MNHTPGTRTGPLWVLVCITGCATTAVPLTGPTVPTAAPHGDTAHAGATPAAAVPQTPVGPLPAEPPDQDDPGTFSVVGHADLPPGPPSSAASLTRAIATAVGPLAPSLASCLRPLGLHGRQGIRVTVDEAGAMEPMNPQRFPAPPSVMTCLGGVLHAATVQPAPPRAVPWDVPVDVLP